MSEELPLCPYCANDDVSCEHLLLIIEGDTQDVGGGVLNDDADALHAAFWEIFEEVARRDSVCGKGLLLEATTAFFWGYGYIAFSNELHAELNRNFSAEYLVDLLDIAPNLERAKVNFDSEAFEYVWSNSAEPLRKLIADRVKDLKRLVSLPLGAPEWTTVDTE